MPPLSEADLRTQIASGKVGPLYLILGPDESVKSGLVGEFLELVEEGLRAFNLDRLYGGETTAATVVDAANTLPMMVPRRVVLLLHAERLLVPKKESEAASKDLERLEAYVKAPVDTACLVLVAAGLDKRRSLTKLLRAKAAVVECTGPADVPEAQRWVRDRVAQEGKTIDPRAARLLADRATHLVDRRPVVDIGLLRADVDRLVLYAGGNKAITAEDVLQVVGSPTSQGDWAVTSAIERGAAGEALRELALLMEDGTAPPMILGQLAWFVRTKVPAARVGAAVEAVFRTDLAIKTSAGDPRALLERLVVELCAR